MTREQAIKAAAATVDLILVSQGFDLDKDLLLSMKPKEDPKAPWKISHLLYMVEQMRNNMSENKTMRWLGFIQGIASGFYDNLLEDLKQINKKVTEE